MIESLQKRKRVTFDDQVAILKERDDRMNSYMKMLADDKNNVKFSMLKKGDGVLVKQYEKYRQTQSFI